MIILPVLPPLAALNFVPIPKAVLILVPCTLRTISEFQLYQYIFIQATAIRPRNYYRHRLFLECINISRSTIHYYVIFHCSTKNSNRQHPPRKQLLSCKKYLISQYNYNRGDVAAQLLSQSDVYTPHQWPSLYCVHHFSLMTIIRYLKLDAVKWGGIISVFLMYGWLAEWIIDWKLGGIRVKYSEELSKNWWWICCILTWK